MTNRIEKKFPKTREEVERAMKVALKEITDVDTQTGVIRSLVGILEVLDGRDTTINPVISNT